MKLRQAKKYIPIIISTGAFVSLFILYNISSSPPEEEHQLSPRHSSYFDEFGKASIYSSPYVSQKGDLFNVRINDKPGVSEPRIVPNPLKQGSFAVVANDFSAEGYATIFITENAGIEWRHSKIPLAMLASNDMYYSDPWADYGSDGSLAYVTVTMRTSEYTRNVVFNISHDNGNTWLDLPVTIKSFESKDILFDKPKVCFDSENNIFVTWLEERKEGSKVSMCLSSDGGKSFGETVTIVEGEIDYADILFDGDNTYFLYAEGGDEIKLISSNDDGKTWGTPEVIARYNAYEDILNKQKVIKSDGDKGIRVNSDPRAVISGGKILLIFAGMSGNGDHSEVYIVSGDIERMEFTEPRPVEPNSAADKFLPAIATDESGNVQILYYSSQNDAENLLTEAYLASTNDFGNTFTYTNLSTESFNPHDVVVAGNYMGDYISLAVNKGKLIAVWTDGRSGNLDLMAGIMPVKF
jgi:hypothetical protein